MSPPSASDLARRISSWAPHAALLLAAFDLSRSGPPLGAFAGLVLLAIGRRTGSRILLAGAAVLVGLASVAWVHDRALGHGGPARAAAVAQRVLDGVEHTHHRLVGLVQAQARGAAALERVPGAVAGEPEARSRLFTDLERLAQGSEERPALAIHTLDGGAVAWSGRISDPPTRDAASGTRVFVRADSTTTTLVAAHPVTDGAGRTLAIATAELTLAVTRRIANEFLTDFDRLKPAGVAVDVRYHDVAVGLEDAPPFPALAPTLASASRVLAAPDGRPIATVRASTPTEDLERGRPAKRYRAAGAIVALAAICAWIASRPSPARLAGGGTILRALLLLLVPTDEAVPLLASASYSSPLLGPLLASPVSLLATSAWVLALAGFALSRALRLRSGNASPARILACAAVVVPMAWAVVSWIADTSAHCSLDLEAVSLLPRAVGPLLVHSALLLVTGAAGVALCAAFLIILADGGGRGRWAIVAAIVACWLLVVVRSHQGAAAAPWFPLVPALLVGVVPAAFVMHRPAWGPRLRATTAGTRAGLLLALVSLGAVCVHATLFHVGARAIRAKIEREHAPSVLRQRAWREHVLREAQDRIETLNVLEHPLPGPYPPGLDQLAFGIWSSTNLAAFGFSSAIEVQDPDGTVVSRFALNLPSLPTPTADLPRSEEWEVQRESVTVASARSNVLHARKLLRYHGDVHGAIHLYVGEDFWNLPYLTGRDPYSVLFRTAARGNERPARSVGLLAYEAGTLVFSSAERPPVLDAAGVAALHQPGAPHWTRLTVDGITQRAYVFGSGEALYVLVYPGRGAGRYAADLVEAAGGLTVLAAALLLASMVVRTLLGRDSLSFPSMLRAIEQRFALRLFVAFTVLAAAPVGVLQLVVRGFIADHLRHETEDQALERARVAKKMVEDYAYLQQAGERPVTDAALVLVASFLRSDLDLFEGGRLVASSKRELYSSGLLPPRVPGPVFRALQLDREPYTLRTETIGRFRYLVASVPVRIDARETAILSIPLPLRQREVDSTIEDLDRTIRLASVLFLLGAALLAQSMARRISGPIRDLTEATQRVARGDMDARVTTTSRDELLRLVESFNVMAGDLAQQRRDLERSNRLAAWAEMARQVAHEVKNPLTPIQLSVEHLRRVWADGAPNFGATLETCTRTVLEQVRTLRAMVTEFSAFARPPVARLDDVDPGALVADVATPYRSALPTGVTMDVALELALPSVRVDRRLVERAVVNLIENALQALGDGGHIGVSVRSTTSRFGRRVEIAVEDTGSGLDPEVRERIFEPFFSTKSTGSGLGLALVKKIAEDHGGGVSLEGPPGEGTRALLWLPVATDPTTPPAA